MLDCYRRLSPSLQEFDQPKKKKTLQLLSRYQSLNYDHFDSYKSFEDVLCSQTFSRNSYLFKEKQFNQCESHFVHGKTLPKEKQTTDSFAAEVHQSQIMAILQAFLTDSFNAAVVWLQSSGIGVSIKRLRERTFSCGSRSLTAGETRDPLRPINS